MQVMSITKKIKVPHNIYRSGFLWIEPGEYEVVRYFDKNRYLIRLPDGLTIVPKFLTQVVA